MHKYIKQINSVVALSLMLITGCATHNDAKLETDMVILTQKMQALNAELITLKAKQAKEQQDKLHLAKQN
jgi:outer membrane murein-binding lipoprotein Lpp